MFGRRPVAAFAVKQLDAAGDEIGAGGDHLDGGRPILVAMLDTVDHNSYGDVLLC